MDLKTIGIVGVGAMGLAMARKLMEAGHEVIGYRRSGLDDFTAAGGIAAGSSGEVAERADVILVCLPHMAALDDVLTREDGLTPGLGPGKIVIETSTLSVADKRLAQQRIEATGAVMLDCPMSGTPGMMQANRGAFFASGDKGTFETTRVVLDAMAPTVTYVGALGGGTVAKFVANMLVGIHNLAAAEALAFAAREGADPALIHQAISGSVGSSAMFELRGTMMVKREYGTGGGVSGFLHGLELIDTEARAVGAVAPMIAKTVETYRAAAAAGFTSGDQAVLFEYLLEAAEKPAKKAGG